MPQLMTLMLPDDVLDALRGRARKCGSTPEDLAVSWLSATVRRIANDPLLRLAGTIRTLPKGSDTELDDSEGPTDESFSETVEVGAATARSGADG